MIKRNARIYKSDFSGLKSWSGRRFVGAKAGPNDPSSVCFEARYHRKRTAKILAEGDEAQSTLIEENIVCEIMIEG
jgi:hypothetical protein